MSSRFSNGPSIAHLLADLYAEIQAVTANQARLDQRMGRMERPRFSRIDADLVFAGRLIRKALQLAIGANVERSYLEDLAGGLVEIEAEFFERTGERLPHRDTSHAACSGIVTPAEQHIAARALALEAGSILMDLVRDHGHELRYVTDANCTLFALETRYEGSRANATS
jgi:hypothetical protein